MLYKVCSQDSMNISAQYSTKQLNTLLYNRKLSTVFERNPIKLTFSKHAFTNWNMRVGPIFTSLVQFYTTLTALFTQSDRIRLFGNNKGFIDNEIVFIYRYDKHDPRHIHIITFYGRISLVPALQSVLDRKLPYVKFKQDEEVLRQQTIPAIPWYEVINVTTSGHLETLTQFYKLDEGKHGMMVFHHNHVDTRLSGKAFFVLEDQHDRTVHLFKKGLYTINSCYCDLPYEILLAVRYKPNTGVEVTV